MISLFKKALVLIALFLSAAGGCSASGDVSGLPYTQTAVCDQGINKDLYNIFLFARDTGIVIPALNQNFVPQGIAYLEKRNWLIISGYFRPAIKSSSSVLLAIDCSSGELVGAYTLVDESGKEVSSHFAGVAVTERDIFVVDGYRLLRVPLIWLEKLTGSGTLDVSEVHTFDIDGGSCNYSDGILWICEHYQRSYYPLQGNHKLVNNDGEEYNAWMVGYQILTSGALKPYCVFSVPDEVQGITVLSGGQVVLSCSYGRTNPSRFLICEDPRRNTPDSYVKISGEIVPLWYLDRKNGIVELSAPPMSEGCCAVDDRVYLIFESGAYYYRAYRPDHIALDPTDRIWMIDLAK